MSHPSKTEDLYKVMRNASVAKIRCLLHWRIQLMRRDGSQYFHFTETCWACAASLESLVA